MLSQLFRQLFRHRPCSARCARVAQVPGQHQKQRRHHDQFTRHYSQRRLSIRPPPPQERRHVTNDRGPKASALSNWQQRSDILPIDKSDEYDKYPMVTADELRGRKERPRRVKMLTRDFIEGSLADAGWIFMLMLYRQLIQPIVWLLLETSGHF